MISLKERQGRQFILACITGFVLALLTNPTLCQAFETTINISPNIINLDSIDHTFGIHTNVPYSIVNVDEVILVCPEDVILDPVVCYADSLGNLVAKFATDELKSDCDLVAGEENILTLEGETWEPVELFSGSGEVLIIESQASLRNGNGPETKQSKQGQNR